MVEVVKESAGDEAKNEPESRFKNFLESGRHESNHATGSILKRGHDVNIPTVASTVSFRLS
jgi:hypothetical protein